MQDYQNNKDRLSFPIRAPPQDAMEASLTRMEIRQGGEAQLQVDSPQGF